MKCLLIRLLSAALFCGILSTQAAPAGQESDTYETLTYKQVGGRRLQVDVFRPSEETPGSDARPAIAFFHGGGWVFGDRSDYHPACAYYAERGFVTCTFQYRLSRNDDRSYPDPNVTLIECIKDARSAIRWMRSNAALLKIDPDRIAAWGWSAGGHLALSTALCNDINEDSDDRAVSPTPRVLLTFSACYNTVQTWCDMVMGRQRARIWDVSPHHRLESESLPPTIGFHGKEDVTEPVRVAYWFREKAVERDQPFELIALDKEGHYLAEGKELPGELRNAAVLHQVGSFLRNNGMMPESAR